MRLLRVFFAGVLIRALRQILLAEVIANVAAHHAQRILAQVRRVGTHIGNVSRFIESLGHHHGFLHAEAKTRAGGLLQRGSDKRRARLAAGRFVFTLQHAVAGFFKQRDGRHGFITAYRTEWLIAVVRYLQRQCIAAWGGGAGVNFPVLFRNERFNFALALDHQTYRNRLDAACGQTAGNFFPQQRRNHIAHHAVHKATRLLSVNTVNIQFARLFESLTDSILGNLVEHHAAIALFITTDNFPQVPCNGLPFAVKVGCEIDVVGFFRQLFEF